MFDLKKARTEAGLTQQQLAERCHVVRTTICEIERGTNKPSVQVAKLIAHELGFAWTEFYDDDDTETEQKGA